MLVARKVNTTLLVLSLAIAAFGVDAFVLLGGLGPPDGVTVRTEGTPVVGAAFRFVLTVRTTAASPARESYLSLSGLNGTFETSPADAVGHPWGRANVWNLSGLDLSYGRTFVLDTTPTWAAEMVLQAKVWSTIGGFGGVQFVNGDDVASTTISQTYRTAVRLTIAWPLAASATPDDVMILGQGTRLRVSVRDAGTGVPIPSPVYLSVVTKPLYYTLATNGTSENPWNATTLWNLTGIDLVRGFDADLTVTPAMTGIGIPLDVIVWSPRGGLDAVQLDGDGVLLTRGAVRLWVDITFGFAVTNA